MAPEGMVHALEIIHSLLHEDGRLIDIHPLGERSVVYALDGDNRYLLGVIEEEDDYIEYRQANMAVDEVIQRGLFTLVQKESFTFSTFASSLEDLREHLAEAWNDAIIEEKVWQNAGRLPFLHSTEQADATLRIELIEKTGIAWLKPEPFRK